MRRPPWRLKSELFRVADFVTGTMENVKEERFEYCGGIVPSVEVKGLEAAEGESVLDIIENETILTGLCPLVESVFEFANDLGKV